jgi:hypothetical protein
VAPSTGSQQMASGPECHRGRCRCLLGGKVLCSTGRPAGPHDGGPNESARELEISMMTGAGPAPARGEKTSSGLELSWQKMKDNKQIMRPTVGSRRRPLSRGSCRPARASLKSRQRRRRRRERQLDALNVFCGSSSLGLGRHRPPGCHRRALSAAIGAGRPVQLAAAARLAGRGV